MIPGYISSPSSNGLHVGPLFLHMYGLMYVLAVAAVILMTRYRWGKTGGDPDLPYQTAIWAFQATFLYEIIWNLSLAAFLVWLTGRRKVRAPGIFALYVAGYSAFRLFEENLRIDYSVHILGMRLNFWIALLLCLGGLAAFVA